MHGFFLFSFFHWLHRTASRTGVASKSLLCRRFSWMRDCWCGITVFTLFHSLWGDAGSRLFEVEMALLDVFYWKAADNSLCFSCINTPAEGQFLWRKQENLQCFEKAAGCFFISPSGRKKKSPLLKNINIYVYIYVYKCESGAASNP